MGIADAKEGAQPLDRWQGHATIEDFNGVLQSINGIQPSVPCSTVFLACQDLPGVVLYVRVDKVRSLHKTSRNDVFIRKGAQCLPVASDPGQFDSSSVRERARVLHRGYRRRTFPLRQSSTGRISGLSCRISHRKTAPLEFCVNENLIDLKNWDPKVCGLVLYATERSPDGLLRFADVITDAGYTHVLNRGPLGVRSPVDRL